MEISLTYIEEPVDIPQTAYEKGLDRAEKSAVGSSVLNPVWGIVEKIYSDSTADVRLHNGILLRKVGVPADGYVSVANNRIVGAKKLPPIGAKVLIIFPGGVVENAFIIASRLDVLGKESEKLLKQGEEKIDVSVLEAGWEIMYNQETGEYRIIDQNGFSLIIKKIEKQIELADWHGNQVVINEAGIKLKDKNGNEFIQNSEGTKIKTGDATNWKPNVLSTCIFSGSPHGGVIAGINNLKGG